MIVFTVIIICTFVRGVTMGLENEEQKRECQWKTFEVQSEIGGIF